MRHVDPQELILQAGNLPEVAASATLGQHQQLDNSDLSALFGIELDEQPVAAASATPAPKKSPIKITKPSKTGSRQNHARNAILKLT